MKTETRLIILFTAFAALWPGHRILGTDVSVPEGEVIDSLAHESPAPVTVPATGKPAREQLERVNYTSELLGNLASPSLREASGIAVSTRSPRLFWSHNDSGYGPYVFVFDLQGEDRGRFYLEGAGSGDWEDMAAFKWRNQSWLLIADTGDNSSRKATYSLYLVAEPEISPDRSPKLRPLRNVQKARIAYPGGPADTEAVAVDSVEERLYLITKRERPVQIFSLPLSVFEEEGEVHMARFETHLFTLPAPTFQDIIENPNTGLAFAQPNAMDFSPDRSFAIVHTYGHSYRFSRTESQSWAAAFAGAPEQFDVPQMKQCEAVAIGWDNRSLYYTSEGKHPPFYRLVPADSTE